MRDDLDIPMPSMGPTYRAPRRTSGMDVNTKRMLIVAGGIGGALLLLVGGWSWTGAHRGGVPVVEADQGPVRVKPADPGGLQVSGQDQAILSNAGGDPAHPAALAASPEAPMPQVLRAQELKAQEAKAQELKAQEQRARELAAVQPRDQPTAPAAPAIVAVPATAAPKAPVALAKAAPVVKPPAAVASGHAPSVQLAALTSEDLAKTEWARLQRKFPDLLGARHPAITRTDRDGKSFWVVRASGFADAAEATAACDGLKGRGAGCFVVN